MNSRLLLITVLLIVVIAIVLWRRTKRRHSSVKAVSSDGLFSVFRSEVDGRPLFANLDMGLRDFNEKQSLPIYVSLSTPLINPTVDGLPTDSDSENLNAWEDSVENQLRSRTRYVYVGRLTWNGHRELLYYVDKQEPAMAALRALLESKTTRPFAFVSERDETWQNVKFWLEQN
jgi:uncharacterized protein DUF695